MSYGTLASLALAQAAAPADGGGGGMWALLIQVGLIIVIFYFLLIRPQQKRAKEHGNMLGNLKREDEVITTGGLIGRIYGITDTVVTLEIAPNVRVKVVRNQIAGLKAPEDAKEEKK